MDAVYSISRSAHGVTLREHVVASQILMLAHDPTRFYDTFVQLHFPDVQAAADFIAEHLPGRTVYWDIKGSNFEHPREALSKCWFTDEERAALPPERATRLTYSPANNAWLDEDAVSLASNTLRRYVESAHAS